MRFAGIVAEYDPFHSGHAWQLAEARRRGAQYIAVALSSAAVQRGSLPLLPEACRVRAALEAGADLVLENPAPCACAGAEAFAAAGVHLLAAAGCDTLVFGTETADAQACLDAARILLSPAWRAALRARLDGGARSFAAARAAAFADAGGGSAALLQNPNDNLGVEYCKAILTQGMPLTPLALPRQGAPHGGGETCGGYASASRLRALWAQDGAAALAPFVPAGAAALYAEAERAGAALDARAFDRALLSRLRLLAQSPAQAAPFASVRGVSEGLEHALENAAAQACTAAQLYDLLTGARYPRARMRRLALDAALAYTSALPALPPYLHVLGGSRGALPLLEHASLPASPSLARLAQRSPACAAMAAAQARAADFAALCRVTPQPCGSAWTQPPVLR